MQSLEMVQKSSLCINVGYEPAVLILGTTARASSNFISLWGIVGNLRSTIVPTITNRINKIAANKNCTDFYECCTLYLSLPILHGFLVRLCLNVQFLASCIILHLDGRQLCCQFIDRSSVCLGNLAAVVVQSHLLFHQTVGCGQQFQRSL